MRSCAKAILPAVKMEGGEYEWVQHVPIAISVGATQAQVDAIADRRLAASCFSDLERTVLRFTEQVVEKVWLVNRPLGRHWAFCRGAKLSNCS